MLTSQNGHKYIVVVGDYFIKWDKAMPTFNNITDIVTQFFFNQVIMSFGICKELISDHGNHFENENFQQLFQLLQFNHEFVSTYYPLSNG